MDLAPDPAKDKPNGIASLKVAILGSFPPQSQGIQGYCGELARALGHRCHVHAVGFRAMYPRFLFPGVADPMDPTSGPPTAPGLTVDHRLAWYNPIGWLFDAANMEADVFHIQWWSLPLAPVCLAMAAVMKARGKRVVVTVHNILPHEGHGFFVLATRLVCGLADAVIVHGQKNIETFRRTYPSVKAPLHAVPIGIYDHMSKPITREDARRKLGIADNAKVTLLFGTIRPYKGLDILLNAFARVVQEMPDAILLVAGKPWTDWEPYARQIQELGLEENIRLHLDYVPADETAYYFAATDLTVLPYVYFDAQSAVAAHNLAFGKPMLVSDSGGLPEMAGNDPAWIVPAGNAAVLADRIADFFSHQTEQSAAYASLLKKIRDALSWNRIAGLHMDIYQN